MGDGDRVGVGHTLASLKGLRMEQQNSALRICVDEFVSLTQIWMSSVIVVVVVFFCFFVVVVVVVVCLLVGCLTSQQHASVSQGRICSDNFTCCHTQIEVAEQTFHLTQSRYTDTGPTSPSTDPITSGSWQGSQFLSHWYDSTPEKSRRKRDSNPGSSTLEADALTTKPTRLSVKCVVCSDIKHSSN